MEVKLVNITPNPEQFISFVARVSNPSNQSNPDYAKLIRYLIKHKHFSPFEHSFATFEITTSMSIGEQILRHRSFSFQKFSGRYSEFTDFEPIELRKQAEKNRQSSTDVFDPIVSTDLGIQYSASTLVDSVLAYARSAYEELIKAGVAKESARFILPATTQTTLYMSGSCRSWLTYLNLRLAEDVQKEHRLIAVEIAKILKEHYPTVAEATDNFGDWKGMFI